MSLPYAKFRLFLAFFLQYRAWYLIHGSSNASLNAASNTALNVASHPLSANNLARIHQPIRIQRRLDLLHDANSIQAQLLDQKLFLSNTHTMFTRARAVHVQRSLHHPRNALLYFLLFLGVLPIIHDAFVEIAVAYVTECRSKKTQFIHFLLGDLDQVG
jgi:hypothetical protein